MCWRDIEMMTDDCLVCPISLGAVCLEAISHLFLDVQQWFLVSTYSLSSHGLISGILSATFK